MKAGFMQILTVVQRRPRAGRTEPAASSRVEVREKRPAAADHPRQSPPDGKAGGKGMA